MPVAKGARLEGKASAQGGFATALDAWMVSARFNGLADASKIAYRKVHEPLKKFFDGPDLQTITGGWAAFHRCRSIICASIIHLDVFELVKRGDFPTVEK